MAPKDSPILKQVYNAIITIALMAIMVGGGLYILEMQRYTLELKLSHFHLSTISLASSSKVHLFQANEKIEKQDSLIFNSIDVSDYIYMLEKKLSEIQKSQEEFKSQEYELTAHQIDKRFGELQAMVMGDSASKISFLKITSSLILEYDRLERLHYVGANKTLKKIDQMENRIYPIIFLALITSVLAGGWKLRSSISRIKRIVADKEAEYSARMKTEKELERHRDHLEELVFERTKKVESTLHELEKSEKKFKSYFEMPLSGVAIFDTEGRWVEINDRMCEILGYSREELLGFTWMDVTYPDDMGSCTKLINEMQSNKRNKYTVEKRYVGKDGNIIPVEVFVGCVRNKEEIPEYYVALVQDISERKKVEAEKELLSQMKTDFLSTAAHELRTPLTTIRGYSELMRDRDGLSNEVVKQFSDAINKESENLAGIINDLLDISKIEAGKSFKLTMQLANLIDCVNAEISLFNCNGTAHEFSLEILGDPYEVLFDPGRVQQILRNLYSNSVKYSESGCKIFTKIEFKEEVALVAVSDMGSGMTQDQVTHVFDKFYRSEEVKNIQGTGLGMSIVKHLVEAHTGRVWVESETSKGTTVSFELPRFSPVWKDEFSVKVASLDNQHKELFALIGRLAKSIRIGEGKESIDLILNELVKYAEFHFKYEEDFFHKHNYPDAARHIASHRNFHDSIGGFKFISHSNGGHLPLRVVSFLYNWLTEHILKEDIGYSSFLMSKGVNELE
jgi:hemerythrin-like metal-binding protein/PAS domain S-box-containing protein